MRTVVLSGATIPIVRKIFCMRAELPMMLSGL
jgi:hypothetical protein